VAKFVLERADLFLKLLFELLSHAFGDYKLATALLYGSVTDFPVSWTVMHFRRARVGKIAGLASYEGLG
jgi:hypothetical protein